MSEAEIDAYLAKVNATDRDVLAKLRDTIRSTLPQADEIISYQIPAFRVDGAVIAGFASYRSHMSYFPFSGAVLGQLTKEIAGYSHTKSALHFTAEKQLPDDLIRLLIATRRSEVRSRGH